MQTKSASSLLCDGCEGESVTINQLINQSINQSHQCRFHLYQQSGDCTKDLHCISHDRISMLLIYHVDLRLLAYLTQEEGGGFLLIQQILQGPDGAEQPYLIE